MANTPAFTREVHKQYTTRAFTQGIDGQPWMARALEGHGRAAGYPGDWFLIITSGGSVLERLPPPRGHHTESAVRESQYNIVSLSTSELMRRNQRTVVSRFVS